MSEAQEAAASAVRVLVVEDDPVAADAHALYVGRVPGFTAVGAVHSLAGATRVLERTRVDLLLLDLTLPDGHGLRFARGLRASGHPVDVIVVTSARDLAVVRESVSLGVVQYVLKPFAFPTLRERLLRYAEFRATAGEAAGQGDVDRALAALRAPGPAELPKGLSAPTLDRVGALLRAAPEGLTAAGAAGAAGISRITARRYLEHLVDTGRADRTPRYGQVGRPELHYRWLAEAAGTGSVSKV
ncbi:response regulator [Streptomyces flavotricini]|uniref:Transcriptional regulatory protein n=1 Tax=Streptomyces flavotricini TaxID=66888 RepID=A0ABS8E1W1_9ACTN|nr:response regulator [Streptomyces flavotricini]MCC0094259.1 response regulator [Streptomyces flavotricini]